MTVPSFVGQSIVGQFTDSAWWPGHFEITQGWGPSDYSGEPEGHGYSHWHAGADIGTPCGTVVALPAQIAVATVRYVDNPGGYGTALVVTVGSFDVWLGHLAARLANPGQVRAGQHLAVTNNTGNSTGCHVHVEVRPKGARYGTDVDPSQWILDPARAAGIYAGPLGIHGAPAYGPGSSSLPTSSNSQDPISAALAAAFQPVASSIQTAEEQFVSAFVGSAQVGLGGLVMLGGAAGMVAGLRGQSLGALGRGTLATFRRGQGQRAGAEFSRERTTQGAIAGDVADQARAVRESRSAAAGERRYHLAAYRAGLVSRTETQRRLGEKIARTGRRPAPGVMRNPNKGPAAPRSYPPIEGYSAQVAREASAARSSAGPELRRLQVRASRIKGAQAPRLAG